LTAEPLRIGTRDSVLATWQARFVADLMKKAGYLTELRFIKTEGDRVLDTPLPLMGGKGVFTKALDDALLAGEIDLAVHSLKDIPTRLPDGLAIGAVSMREDPRDVLVARRKNDSGTSKGTDERKRERLPDFLSDPGYEAVIASSSNRRIGQWLARFPGHRIVDIRGNIQTRLRKLRESEWDGAIFAAAGLLRLGLEKEIDWVLDWMLPAPAQGAMAMMIRTGDKSAENAVRPVHDSGTALCTAIERDVLHHLEGGCSAPVGAWAAIQNGMVWLKINTVYPDGHGLIEFEMTETRSRAGDLGRRAAEEALRRGADGLIRDLRGAAMERQKVVIATRPPAPGDTEMAKSHGIRLVDCPAYYYRWITPSDFIIDPVVTPPLPDAWVFTSRRGVEGWWRIWKNLAGKQEQSTGRSLQSVRNYTLKIPHVYVIGDKTEQAFRETFGEGDIRKAEEHNGKALGMRLTGDNIRSAVHFCAVERQNDLYLKALAGDPVPRPPVWMMRQAGRYLPSYLRLQEKYDFFTRCETPELVAEITCLPIDEIGPDAAILFSDILVVPRALGQPVEMKRAWVRCWTTPSARRSRPWRCGR
jgi:hydroxymethylbilane synthase